jgi:cell division transport system permease protein
MSGEIKPTLLPPENLAGPALSAVTMVMTFLACLALGCSILADRAADRWLARATSAISVQIIETTQLSAEDQLPAVLREIQATPGIGTSRILPRDDLVALLEPWLGTGNIGEDMPLPLLIEIIPAESAKLPTASLSARLKAVAPGARLDTHGRWRETLEGTARALELFAALVLAMVTLATATVILFATRAGLLANEEILNVLHQIGAHDGYISRRFEGHFVRVVSLAAMAGLAAALVFFYALGGLIAEARDLNFLIYLTPLPLAAIVLSWQVTRRYVLRNLRAQL